MINTKISGSSTAPEFPNPGSCSSCAQQNPKYHKPGLLTSPNELIEIFKFTQETDEFSRIQELTALHMFQNWLKPD